MTKREFSSEYKLRVIVQHINLRTFSSDSEYKLRVILQHINLRTIQEPQLLQRKHFRHDHIIADDMTIAADIKITLSPNFSSGTISKNMNCLL